MSLILLGAFGGIFPAIVVGLATPGPADEVEGPAPAFIIALGPVGTGLFTGGFCAGPVAGFAAPAALASSRALAKLAGIYPAPGRCGIWSKPYGIAVVFVVVVGVESGQDAVAGFIVATSPQEAAGDELDEGEEEGCGFWM